MGLLLIAEQVFFVMLFLSLFVGQMALIVRLNNSAKRTRLLIPLSARVGLLLEAVFLTGSIIVVLLTKL